MLSHDGLPAECFCILDGTVEVGRHFQRAGWSNERDARAGVYCWIGTHRKSAATYGGSLKWSTVNMLRYWHSFCLRLARTRALRADVANP